MPEALIAFGPCEVRGPDGDCASVGSIRFLEDGGIEVVIEDPTESGEDTTIRWEPKSVAPLLGSGPWDRGTDG